MKKKILIAVFACLSVATCGCQSVTPSAKPKSSKPQMTTARQWVETENAKKLKCDEKDGIWLGGGSNGYDSYSVKCVKGLVLYTDTTAETQRWLAQEQKRKTELAWMLRTCVLTQEQMEEVMAHGTRLYVHDMVPYMPADVEARLNEALLQQAKLKAVGAQTCASARK